MCLTITSNWEEELKAFKENISGESFIAYKLLENNKSIFNKQSWQVGVIQSNRESVSLTNQELDSGEVNKGIHLYIDKPKANCLYDKSLICPYPRPYPYRCLHRCRYLHRHPCQHQSLIEVEVNINDLVAIGTYGKYKSLIATKVTVNSMKDVKEE